MALLRRAFQFLFVPQLLTDLGSPKLTSPQALRKAFGDRTPICSSRGSRCRVTTATVYRNPSWDELETSPWDERSPCNKHYVIGKASLLGGSGESPRCCSLPDRDEPASSASLRGSLSSCTGSPGTSPWAPGSASPCISVPPGQAVSSLAASSVPGTGSTGTHSWDVFTLQGSSTFSGIWLWEGETLFGAQQSCWQDSSVQACREGWQEHGSVPPRPAVQPSSTSLPWPWPCGQLQTAVGGTRASMAWLPALPFPTAKGCSRIHCCNQR